jgi:DNA polymerase III sliding clamp (beta) subunit (PCNA family)
MNPITLELPAAELKTALTGLGKVINKRCTLPVLAHLRVTRTSDGAVTLQATDLDTTVIYAAEQPSEGPACDFLVPFDSLNQFVKGGKEPVQLIREAKDKVRLKTHIGTSPMDQTLDTPPVRDYPPMPVVDGKPVALDASFRDSLRQALDCTATGYNRDWSQHVCVDTRYAEGHYLAASDGSHFFCANSFQFDLKQPVLIPEQPFLRWSKFMEDGMGELSVQGDLQTDAPLVQFKSGRWTCISKAGDGEFPKWKHIVAESKQPRACIELDQSAVETLLAGVPKLPCGQEFRRPVTLEVLNGTLIAKARARDAKEWTCLILQGVKPTGKAVSVTLNRDYLLKALRFGLNTVEIEDELKPVQFHEGGRRMVVSPIVPSETPPPTTASPAPNPQSNNSNPPVNEQPSPAQPQETSPMPKETQTSPTATATPTETSPVKAVIQHVENIKETLKGVLKEFAEVMDGLKVIEKEKRATDKEIESVREKLREIQAVRI